MKVLILYDNSGPKYHRLFLPMSLMTLDSNIELSVHRHLPDDLSGVDIVYFNRLITNKSINDVNGLRDKYGFKLVCDFDDHWLLDKDHYLYRTYQQFNASEVMEEWIKICDCVTVTHERLAADVRLLNENVHVLPNAIPNVGQFKIIKQHDDCVRLFWAGGVTHRKDIETVAPTLQRLKSSKVKLVLGGYVAENPEWKEMAKSFTGNSSFNTEVLESLPVEHYYAMYSKCDISVVPLRDGRFNSFKSNLKILEAANAGCPVVVSKVHPYLDFPDDIVNYVDGFNPWYKQIKKLLDNPELAKEQGQRLKEYCNEHFNFDKINEKRKQILLHEAGKQGHIREIQAEVQSVAI